MAVDVLKLSGDYKVVTAASGTITLDTGVEKGEVVVTGNLTVQGNTTTVNTANLDIEDNILLLNKGETGAGVTLTTAGLEIERGPNDSNATLLWDDSKTYVLPNGGTGTGSFTFKIGNNLSAIRTHFITTEGEDLVLLGGDAPSGKLSVRGTTNYESGLTDDDIPNVKYVNEAFETIAIPVIARGNTDVRVQDLQEGDASSNITGRVDGVTQLLINNDRIELGSLTIDDNTIRPTTSNSELILQANGTGTVVIDDVLSIANPVGSAPAGDTGRLKLYVQSEGGGGTGLFFVNNTSRDEITSKKKTMLFSMIF
jgi:hypothetical protein